MDLPERLRLALEELELSQAELARRTGLSRGTVNKIVNGKRQPNAAQLGLLAHELGLGLDELLGEPAQERELIEQQLRKAVLRTARSERARSEQAATATTKIAKLERELSALQDCLGAERSARAKEREELRVSALSAHARAQTLELRLREMSIALERSRAEVERLRRELASSESTAPSGQQELPFTTRAPAPRERLGARSGTAHAAGELAGSFAGYGFTELVLALALHKHE